MLSAIRSYHTVAGRLGGEVRLGWWFSLETPSTAESPGLVRGAGLGDSVIRCQLMREYMRGDVSTYSMVLIDGLFLETLHCEPSQPGKATRHS